MSKFIEETLVKFWITKDNIKDYKIEIKCENNGDKKIYINWKLVWETHIHI